MPVLPRGRRARSSRAARAAVLALLAACSPAPADDEPRARIRGTEVSLEIVRTPEAQALGLGRRDSLEWGRGMLFPYESPAFRAFWMKDMRFDIDIVWIRKGRIVDLHHRVPHPKTPGENVVTVQPKTLADTVLEVPAGFAQANGWAKGDRVEITPNPASH